MGADYRRAYFGKDGKIMLLIGRSEICQYLGGRSWQTIRRWKRKYNLPIRPFPPNIPCLETDELKAWLVKYKEIIGRQIKKS